MDTLPIGARRSGERAPIRVAALRGATSRPAPFGRAASFWCLLLLMLASLSCSEDASGPDGGGSQGGQTLSFRLGDSTFFDVSGNAAWPPSGSGVIARTDTAGMRLQVAAYRKTSAKPGALAGPEPRFDFLYIEIGDTAPIGERAYPLATGLFCRDLAVPDFDSGGYALTGGTLTVESITPDIVAGSFSFAGMRRADSAGVSISAGIFRAQRSAPLIIGLPGDSGDAGGAIALAADTGTTPVYSWTGGPVYALSVVRAAQPGVLAWGVAAEGDSIASGVRQGVIPPGAFGTAAAESVLARGVAYKVTVSRTDGAYGWRLFTP